MISILKPDNRYHFLVLLLAGALLTLAFQPFNLLALALIAFGVLMYSWNDSSPRQAMVYGWWFSMGLQCSGISWIFYSLHYHGGAPVFLAVLMIFLLSAYLSIYPALALWLVKRFCSQHSKLIQLMLLLPMSWGLFEWLQGVVMTGFAWMQPGYLLIDTPLAGYAPVTGNHGLSILLMVITGAIVTAIVSRSDRVLIAVIAIGVIVFGALLQQVQWTTPTGEPIRVSLIQGNIPQHLKWKREMHRPTLDRYQQLTSQQQDADLIIWPETAIPGYKHRLPNYLAALNQQMQKQQADLLLGVFVKDPSGGYHNSLYNVNGETYRKRHLVPLGEYIPLRFLIDFFNRWIDIPMSDILHGDMDQPLLQGGGVALGVSICFEDAFARDVIRDLPEAALLVNVSNDAWFEGSHEPRQHHAIARMRALETGRTMLRVTNTGVTSIIGADGVVQAEAPEHEIAVLKGEVYARTGSTPFVRWGNSFIVVLASVVLLIAGFTRREKTATSIPD